MATSEQTSSNFNSFLKEAAERWKRAWSEAGVDKARVEPGRPKYFVTAAFPYTNGPLHLGHALTYVLPDVVARYKRMKGYSVLFPMGFHYTGTPIISMSEAVAKGDPKVIRRLIEDGVPEGEVDRFADPLYLADHFRDRAVASLKSLLLSIDWDRSFTSVDPEFQRFVEWQFRKLREAGYLVQGTHPVGWCPYHQSPVSMHDTLNDIEPEIAEFTLIMFRTEDGTLLPAATLRPETVFGVTNIWVNPTASYVLVEANGSRMVVSEQAAYKLSFQRKGVKTLGKVDVSHLLEAKALNPVTGELVDVLPAAFVDPDTGTGVVMSVPAHAPFDYAALKELGSRGSLSPISIIDLRGRPSYLAVELVERHGIKGASSREDVEALEELTKQAYLMEFSEGVMSRALEERVRPGGLRDLARSVAGLPVSTARDVIKALLIERGLADVFYEIANKPVYCRCGTPVVVKVLENQWFIDYENEEWKRRVLDALARTEICPEDYRDQFVNVVGWLKRKACARSRGLGTALPWDKSWIIESLSDSTIYMAFYTVVHRIRRLGIPPERLDDPFWDYVMLGRGDPSEVARHAGVPLEELLEMRREFEYWYPLDARHSGKDLVPNHLTFMVFNHVAIFPSEKWPRRIVVNGHIMVEGAKMSKSLGNFITIDRALSEVSPDVLRLALVMGAEIGNDVNYTKQLAQSVLERLRRIRELVLGMMRAPAEEAEGFERRLLRARFARYVLEAENSLERCRLRTAAVAIFHGITELLESYLKATGGRRTKTMESLVREWIKMMAPFTPAFAEELWHELGGTTLIVTEKWPDARELGLDELGDVAWRYVEVLVQDIRNVRSLFPESKRVVLLPASEGSCYPAVVARSLREGRALKDMVRELARAGVPNPFEYAKRISSILEGVNLREETIEEFCRSEPAILRGVRRLVEVHTGIAVEVYSEGDHEYRSYLETRKQRPLPMKPLIVLV